MLGSLLSRFRKDDRGSFLTMFGLSLIPVVVSVGVVVDYSRASNGRSQMQSSLDSAVLGGVRKPLEQRATEATQIFNVNMKTADGPVELSFQNQYDGSLSGVARRTFPSVFGGIGGLRGTTTVQVESAAAINAGLACVLVLDPTGAQSLLVNGGAQLNAPQCEVHVRSTANPAAIFNSGTNLVAKRFCVAGTNVIQNSTVTANLELGCTPANDPFVGRFPAPSTFCTVSSRNYSGAVTLDPGVYCGWFNFNGVTDVTFNPGVYVLRDGGWNVAGGSFKGSGVSFYFADSSKIQFNSGMDTDLTPPTSGPYKSVLFHEAAGLAPSDFIFNNSLRNRLEGLIYLPSRNMIFNADSKLANDKTTLVVNRLIWNSMSLALSPSADLTITAPTTSASSASAASGGARLVR